MMEDIGSTKGVATSGESGLTLARLKVGPYRILSTYVADCIHDRIWDDFVNERVTG